MHRSSNLGFASSVNAPKPVHGLILQPGLTQPTSIDIVELALQPEVSWD